MYYCQETLQLTEWMSPFSTAYHSHTRRLLSSEVETNRRFWSTNVMVLTAPRCRSYSCTISPDLISHWNDSKNTFSQTMLCVFQTKHQQQAFNIEEQTILLLHHPLTYRPSAAERFRLPPLTFGMRCHTISFQHHPLSCSVIISELSFSSNVVIVSILLNQVVVVILRSL